MNKRNDCIKSNGRSFTAKSNIAAHLSSNQCAICLENIVNLAIATECKHSFCYECINEWIRVHNKCPLCRTIIRTVRYNIRPKINKNNEQNVQDQEQQEEYDVLNVNPPVLPPEYVIPITETISFLVTPEQNGLFIISPVRRDSRIYYESQFFPQHDHFIIRNSPGTLFVMPEDYEQVIAILENVGIYPIQNNRHGGRHAAFFRRHRRHHPY